MQLLATALNRTSLTSVDLPEPDTPVTHVSDAERDLDVDARRLCWVAPRISMSRSASGAGRAPSIVRVPARNCPVSDA